MEHFDVVVCGAGPTGLACGIELKRRGVKAVLIDKGCVVNSLYHYPTNMVFFTTPELLEIGDIPMTSLNDKPVRAEALKYYRRVAEHYKLDIRQYQHVSQISGNDGDLADVLILADVELVMLGDAAVIFQRLGADGFVVQRGHGDVADFEQ